MIRQNLPRFVALLVTVFLYLLSLQPTITSAERSQISEQFSFKQFEMPDEEVSLDKYERDVAPNMKNIVGWVSSTGAGVALSDFDGDGLSNDLCKVDPRTDNVLIAPAPTTGDRFQPFILDTEGFVNEKTAPMGCIPNDYNEDGITDILVYYWGRTPLVFLAKGTPDAFLPSRENYKTQESVKSDLAWFTGGATVADVDGDSHLDVIIGNYFQDGAEILDGKTKSAQSMHASMSRATNGGKSYILRWTKAESGENPSVSFETIEDFVETDNQEEKDQIIHGWTLALGACDLTGDLLPELYFGNDFGNDRFLYNMSKPGEIRFRSVVGRKGFTTPNSKVMGHDSFKGMGVDFGDANSDGLLDLYISSIADEYALEESHLLFINTGKNELYSKGIAPFEELSEDFGVSRSSWAWETRFADLNNDGQTEILQAVGFLKGETDRWAELHEVAMGNDNLLSNPQNWHKLGKGDDLSGHDHNRFYARAKDGRFYDIAEDIGMGHPQVSRGIATADVNGDGKLDFAVANQWDTSFFYLNEAKNADDFLGLKLRLPIADEAKPGVFQEAPKFDGKSRPAIGAHVSVEMSDGKKRVAFVDGGNGHSGKRSSSVHFGLGKMEKQEKLKIEVRWINPEGNLRTRSYEVNKGWNTIVLGE